MVLVESTTLRIDSNSGSARTICAATRNTIAACSRSFAAE
jgi:hypothetical protein